MLKKKKKRTRMLFKAIGSRNIKMIRWSLTRRQVVTAKNRKNRTQKAILALLLVQFHTSLLQ